MLSATCRSLHRCAKYPFFKSDFNKIIAF